jgi:hypothetical protein
MVEMVVAVRELLDRLAAPPVVAGAARQLYRMALY